LQDTLARVVAQHPGWPRVRIGVNSGDVIVREIGSHGHVAYPSVGDTVNTGARLEGLAPSGGVLIGAETYRRLPAGAVVERWSELRMKGKDDPIDAYLLLGCRSSSGGPRPRGRAAARSTRRAPVPPSASARRVNRASL
jgi:class 3 adenylate cyclase